MRKSSKSATHVTICLLDSSFCGHKISYSIESIHLSCSMQSFFTSEPSSSPILTLLSTTATLPRTLGTLITTLLREKFMSSIILFLISMWTDSLRRQEKTKYMKCRASIPTTSHLEQFQVLPISTKKTQRYLNRNVVPYLRSVVCYRTIVWLNVWKKKKKKGRLRGFKC